MNIIGQWIPWFQQYLNKIHQKQNQTKSAKPENTVDYFPQKVTL